MGELGLLNRFSTPAKTLEKAEALQAKVGDEIQTLLQRVDAKATPDVLPNAAGLFQRARTELIEPLEANLLRPHQQEAAGRLRSLVDGLEQKLANEARGLERVDGLNGELTGAPVFGARRVGFEQLHELRSQLTDAITDLSGAAEPATQELRRGLQSLRTYVSDELGTAMERAGFSSKVWQQAERQYQVASLAAEFAEKGLERAKAANPFAPSKLLGTLRDIATNGLGSETLRDYAKGQAGQFAPGLLSSAARKLREYLEKEGASAAKSLASSDAQTVLRELSRRANLTAEENAAVQVLLGSGAIRLEEQGAGPDAARPSTTVVIADANVHRQKRDRRTSWSQ